LAAYFKENFTQMGGSIVAEEGFVKGDRDFNATLTKNQRQQPRFYLCTGYNEEVAPLIKQARELGIAAPIGGGDGWDSPDMISVAGAQALNNTFFTTIIHHRILILK
jgi:branched-chain amino acid transport system substrate-binding protein